MSEYRVQRFAPAQSPRPHEQLANSDWPGRPGSALGGAIKRAMDIALALVALVLLAPLLVILAAALRLAIGRPIICQQKMVGFGGGVFTAYRFRAGAGDEAAVAACLQAFGLDKLPQLFNVLRGDMSFVGPQPLALDARGRAPSHANEYVMARPGLIGLRLPPDAGGPDGSTRADLDRYYVRRWSLGLDLMLLVKSIAAPRDREA
jgi:exopolysaccharide production protein ExoY